MATAACLPIAADRAGPCVRTIFFEGLNLTGIPLALEARLNPETPGPAAIALGMGATANAEGLRLVGVTVVDGYPTSQVVLRINETTMKDAAKVPYSGELGSSSVLYYDLIGTFGQDKRRLVYGTLAAVPTVYGMDAAPTNRPPGGSAMPGNGAWSNARAIFSDDDVRVTIDGPDLIAPLVAKADDAAARAETAQGQSQQSAASAALAASGAMAASNLYPTVAAGLAAAQADGFFTVVGDDANTYAILYQKVSGAAVEKARYASKAALDRMGRVVPAQAQGDNAVAINAALADPLVGGVILPPGAYGIDTTIVVPEGKFLRGSGRGVTTITRRNATVTETGFDPALVRSASNAKGVRVSDLTLVAPKTGVKVHGVWLRGAVGAVVERVECFNMGYAFWAQEYASRCVFRDVWSWNANVHFETTQAYDILFENMVSGDGDGDNPLGCEAIWHTLLASRRITFRNGRHTGKGQPFLVVANDINSDPQGGLIDQIRFEGCRSEQTSDKIGLFVSKINGTVGRIELIDCSNTGKPGGGGLPARIETGNVYMRGGVWISEDKGAFDVGGNASLIWDNPSLTYRNIAAGDQGAFFGAAGPVRINGGSLTANIARIDLGGPNLTLSPETQITRPGNDKIYRPEIGAPSRYRYKADLARTGDAMVGNDSIYATAGEPALAFVPTAGAAYRLRFAGKIRKDDAASFLRIYFDAASNIDFTRAYGSISIQKADGSYEVNTAAYNGRGAQIGDAAQGAVRQFIIDVTFTATDSVVSVFSGAGAHTILAGATVIIERLN